MNHFHSPSKGILNFNAVVEELLKFIENEPKDSYSIVVGSDSEQGATDTEFISAIVIHRHGRGGRYFWSRKTQKNFHTLRERIWRETTLSTELGQKLLQAFKSHGNGFKNVEIHVDIGKRGPTRELIKEICGYVRGVGFEVCIKPEAYAACAVADKMI